MTTRTWNGATADFTNAAGWSGGVVPVAGDTAVINSGTVTATGPLPTPITITMDGANGPTLALSNGQLGGGTRLLANDETNFVALSVAGATATNWGAITFTGQADGAADVVLTDTPGSTTRFINIGGISVVGQDAVFVNEGVNVANDIVNNGMISFRSGGTTGNLEIVNTAVDGTGTIRLQPNTNLLLGAEVSSGQTIVLEPGSGGSVVTVGDGVQFGGVFSGFGSSDQIRLSTTPYDNVSYSISNGIGTFTFTSGANVVGRASFAGGFPQSAFTLAREANSPVTDITTSIPEQPVRVSFSDVDNGVSGDEPGTPYTGPVAGLQYQYIWPTADSVAISSAVPNVFLKGGTGNDALAVTSGNNVLDGGAGSNFLVGGTGQDTFFVDGRGNTVTWSTVVGFHPGDQATVFGFQAGVSTLPVTARDGVGQFTGVTIHSELNGAGTGVNGSLTLAGLTVDDLNNHMTLTFGTLDPGTPSALPYMLIQYNR